MAVVLLVHCDGANGSTTFTDISPSAHPLTITGTVTVSTAQVKFGTGSALISSSSRIYTNTALSDFDFQSGPFTIELWAYATTAPGISSLFSQFTNASTGGWFFGAVSGNLAFWYYDGSGTRITFASSTAITGTGAWHHYAADRDVGGTLRIYVDGVVAASTSAPTFQSALQEVNIGNSNRVTDYWPGYIDEVRVQKGVAQYAGPFTPPTAPFDIATVIGRQTAVSVNTG